MLVDRNKLCSELNIAYGEYQRGLAVDEEPIKPQPEAQGFPNPLKIHQLADNALASVKKKAEENKRRALQEGKEYLGYENCPYEELVFEKRRQVAMTCTAIWLGDCGWHKVVWHGLNGNFRKVEAVLFGAHPFKCLEYLVNFHKQQLRNIYNAGNWFRKIIKKNCLEGLQVAIEERLERSITLDQHLPGFLNEIGKSAELELFKKSLCDKNWTAFWEKLTE